MQTNSTVYFSDILPSRCPKLYQSITDTLRENHVSFGLLRNTKDIWCRDYMPIHIGTGQYIFYKYNPDYLQTPYYSRTKTDVMHIEHIEYLECATTKKLDLVIDGGNVVKCGNSIVMTEKVFAENREKSRSEIVKILEDAFQGKVIFLPWDKNEIFGHSDGIIHFLEGNRILLTNYADFDKTMESKFRKILEQHFEVITLNYNVKRKHQRSWAYINYLQIGKLILVPELDIEEDIQAQQQISKLMPNHKVIGIPALEAVRRGGALNCISWNKLS